MLLHDAQGKRLYLTADERRTFMAASVKAERPARLLGAVLHDTGCRSGEALALTPARVDLPDMLSKRMGHATLKVRRSTPTRSAPVSFWPRSQLCSGPGGGRVCLPPVSTSCSVIPAGVGHLVIQPPADGHPCSPARSAWQYCSALRVCRPIRRLPPGSRSAAISCCRHPRCRPCGTSAARSHGGRRIQPRNARSTRFLPYCRPSPAADNQRPVMAGSGQ